MDPHFIPRIKKIIRGIQINQAQKMAQHVRTLYSTEEINRYLSKEMKQKLPFDFNTDSNPEE